MAVTKKDVEYIAELARLNVGPEEVEGFIKDLNNILGYVEKLGELDTEDVDILVNPLPLSNIYREDEVEESLAQEDFLANAPERVEDYLRVPSVIEMEE